MATFQTLTGYVNLGGERNNVAFRGPDNPITYPESLILAAIHGGQEHVHGLVAVGSVEREPAEELERLSLIYGAELVHTAFPRIAGRASLPERDENILTTEEVEAIRVASEDARASVKAKGSSAAKSKGKPAKTDTAEPAAAVPSLDDLPK